MASYAILLLVAVSYDDSTSVRDALLSTRSSVDILVIFHIQAQKVKQWSRVTVSQTTVIYICISIPWLVEEKSNVVPC